MSISEASLLILRSLIDRLIPRDDFPGATDAGVDEYILRQLASDCAGECDLIAHGLQSLDASARTRHGRAFDSLSASEQDALLTSLERDDSVSEIWSHSSPALFFRRMVELAAEGYYADPGQGGNRGAVSWRMIGYDRRGPGDPSTP